MIEIPLEIVTLEDESYHLLITCRIGSRRSFLVLDTGASKTVLDATTVENYVLPENCEQQVQSHGLGNGEIDTQLVDIAEIEFGEVKISGVKSFMQHFYNYALGRKCLLKISNFRCALIDLSALNEMYMQFCNRKISGLLGSDFLLKHAAVIDYQRKTLYLQSNL